jgi:sodium-coupled neutral amino acid transporter 11
MDEVKEDCHDQTRTGYHMSSLNSSIPNLVKNLIGASMLAMPYGVSVSGLFPAVVLCILIGSLSAYTFAFLGIACGEAKVDTYRQACEKYLGHRGTTIIDIILVLYTLPCCLGYGVFVCDCMRTMLVEIFPRSADEFFTSRAFIGIVMTVFILLPLCSFRKIQSLTLTSVLGLGALLYCYIYVAVDLAENSDVIASNIEGSFWWPSSGSFIALLPVCNIFSACFLVQYNSPKFFFELRNPTNKRFWILSYVSTAIVILFCGSFAVMGFARFGVKTPGNLLTSYSGAYAVWIATSLSLITTYPFDFDAGRRSVVSMLTGMKPWLTEERVFWGSTFILIPVFSAISALVDNLSIIVGMNGSLFGVTVGFTIPGLLLYRKVSMEQEAGRANVQIWTKWLGLFISILGFFMSILGFSSLFIKFK